MENNLMYHIKRRDSMKTINVIFVSDELIGSTIVSKKEYERVLRQKIKTEADKSSSVEVIEETKAPKRKALKNNLDYEINSKRSKFIDDVELALAALENDNVEKVDVTQPSTLFEEGDVSAKKMYNFENSNHSVKIEKPLNNVSSFNSDQNSSAIQNKEKKTSALGDISQTPITLRRKVIKDIKAIQKILENSDDDFSSSDSDSSFKMSDDSLSDSSHEETDSKIKKSAKSFFENYCDLHSSKNSKHPLNTLRKLKTSKLTQEKLDDIVQNAEISSVHKKCIQMLLTDIINMFNKWDFILKQNFNLLLYGAGSKREVISKFVERFIDVSPVVVVNGFFPDITGKEILEKICQVLEISFENIDMIDKIENKLKHYDLEIYLAINNVDGIMLRNRKVQNMLSRLGKIEQIHIIASIDHINAPLMWDKRTNSEFNWIWFDSTTFLTYSDETLYEGNLMLPNSGKATLSSLRNVFNALTKNSRGIFLIMVKNQVESENKSGISFRELYEECRKELLISSDVALRSQLKEFIDHMILKQKKSADGEEQFFIVMENNILRQFLDEQEAQQS